MKKSLFVFTLLLIATFAATTPLYAGTVSWSGRLENPDSIWFRVDDGCGPATTNDEWYDTQVFSVDTAGNYTIDMIAMSGSISPDGYYALYDTSFDPSNPTANCIGTDDDSGGGLVPSLTAALQAGRTYILVTTQCCDGVSAGEEMNYTNEITGPGNITFGVFAVGGCTYPLPQGLSQGLINATVTALWEADATKTTNVVIPGGSSWFIMATEGDYVQLWIACQGSPVWVPASAVSR